MRIVAHFHVLSERLSSVSSIHKEAKILAFARLYEKQFHLIYRQNWIMSVCNTCPGKECAHTKERDGRARGIGQFPFERFQFSCLLAPNRQIVSFYPPKMPRELDLLLLRLNSRNSVFAQFAIGIKIQSHALDTVEIKIQFTRSIDNIRHFY